MNIVDELSSCTFYIGRDLQIRLIRAAERARDMGTGLDQALEIEPEIPRNVRARRDYFLRRANELFRVPAGRSRVSAFRERIQRAARQEWKGYLRTGQLPRDSLSASLCLALAADDRAAQLSEKQLRRVLDSE